jgi:photoactive yellow protein
MTSPTIDDLSALGPEEIDSLPFGYIALAPDGTIRKYNRYEADLAGTDPRRVLGRNFFRDVAPCTQVAEFEGRFRQLVEGETAGSSLTFDFEFRFRHGTQAVRIGFVRSPLDKEVIVTVNRVHRGELPLTAAVHHDPVAGILTTDDETRVVTVTADFWRALDRAVGGARRRDTLHHLGLEWGLSHALDVERLVQREHGTTLRETELQMALETLSGSLGVRGLGRFDVDLGLRRRGLLLITHQRSPFAGLGTGDRASGDRCALLAGLHAGFVTYLSGRSLVGRELSCGGGRPGEDCRFLVGTEERLARLFDPADGSSDAELLDRLGGRSEMAATEGQR